MFRFGILILIFLLISSIAFAQDIKFTSSVNKKEFDANEVINFKITIEGNFKTTPKIDLPKLEDDFDVVSQSTSENITWQKGEAKRLTVLQFGLLAKKEGILTIGPAKLKVGLKEYLTAPIEIKITGKIDHPQAEPEEIPQEGNQEQITL
ncbi:MAG: BatD family protein [Candidatus Omnitrophota bacterium]